MSSWDFSRGPKRSSSIAITAGASAHRQENAPPNGQNYGRSDMTTRHPLSRRGLLAGAGAVGAAAFASRRAAAQAQPAPNAQLGTPASTISSPPRDWTPGRPSIYPDPDVIVIDPAFNSVRLGSAPIRRVWTGANWAEGPAWSSQGQYLVFSDVTGNVQYRYIWEDGRVTPYRRPSKQHQRQFLRPSGAAIVLRGFLPARRALGA